VLPSEWIDWQIHIPAVRLTNATNGTSASCPSSSSADPTAPRNVTAMMAWISSDLVTKSPSASIE